jgi:dolichol-phosphate mannosyltransferase
LGILIPDIEEVFKEVKHEIIVVDDDSSDNTGGKVLELNRTYGNIKLITRKNRRGLGSAIREGYNSARSRVVLSSDADLSFSVKDMKKLFDKINQGFDLVIGCRHNINGSFYEMKELRTTLKGLISRLGNTILKFLAGIEIDDFSANFRAMKMEAWNALDIRDGTNAMLFEMIIKAKNKNFKITQIPVIFVDRIFGKSKLNLMFDIPRAAIKALYYLIKLG